MTGSGVARVAVDIPLPHLDRFFDYTIPEAMSAEVVPGCRVKVRFAGRLRDGFVIDRVAAGQGDRELSPLQRVISSEVVLTPPIVATVRAVADHYAGTFSDVVRLAVPPRHGMTETATRPAYPAPTVPEATPTLSHYPHGEAFAAALTDGRSPRAALALAPVHGPPGDWVGSLVEAAAATLAGGRGALLLVPDARDLRRLAERCTAVFGRGSFVSLTAEVGPAARYRAFLAASRGQVRLVLGTRAAAFAPVADLGLIAMVDDGDDSFAELRAPYPHARVVASLRAGVQGCGLLFAGYARSSEVQALVEKDWLVSLEAPTAARREACPLVRVAVATDRDARDPAAHSRLPHEVFSALRAGLAGGPVLVQVPRGGYLPGLVCGSCRAPAVCPQCSHPLTGEGGGGATAVVARCRLCGPKRWACGECGGDRLRAPRVGAARTAEELGKAFPQVKVVQSFGDHVVDAVDAEPALVIATPGAEPVAEGGFAAAVLLDADTMLGRADLRAAEETLRRWLAVCARVRGAEHDGTVVVVADPAVRAVQALVRLDAVGFARRELADRAEARFPPAACVVSLEGAPGAVAEGVRLVRADLAAEVLGPVPSVEDNVLATLRVPNGERRTLVAATKAMLAQRSAHKADGNVRVRVDPWVLG